MLSGVLKPDDKPVSICIHLIVCVYVFGTLFWAPFQKDAIEAAVGLFRSL